MSDFHFTPANERTRRLSDELLLEAIGAINRERPDVVALVGDFVNHETEAIFSLVDILRKIEAPNGVFAVLGNHDHHGGEPHLIKKALRDVGIRTLSGEAVYPMGDRGPALVGLADFQHGFSTDVLQNSSSVSDGIPRIVLSHNPDSAEVLAAFRVDLQISGHTHGGQVRVFGVPLLRPAKWFVSKLPPSWAKWLLGDAAGHLQAVKHWEWSAGLHQVPRTNSNAKNLLYVTRGLGSQPPGRFFCPPELSIFELQPS